MKKLATTFGLLALLLIVTSFTTPSEIGGGGNQGAPRDTGTGTGIAMNYEIGGGGNQGAPRDTGTGTGYEIGGGGNQGAPRGTGTGLN